MELQDKYIRFDWAVKRLLRHKAKFWCARRIPYGTDR